MSNEALTSALRTFGLNAVNIYTDGKGALLKTKLSPKRGTHSS